MTDKENGELVEKFVHCWFKEIADGLDGFLKSVQETIIPYSDRAEAIAIGFLLGYQLAKRETIKSYSYWYCPHCKEEVDSSCVTYQELHDGCGHPVEWIEGCG